MVSSTRGDAVVVTLLEEDIEGALLEEPLKTKTIPQVHWWLLCHGIKASLNDTKPALLKRVRNNNTEKIPVVDGTYLEKKRQQLLSSKYCCCSIFNFILSCTWMDKSE